MFVGLRTLTRTVKYPDGVTAETWRNVPMQFFPVVGHPTDNNVRISKKPVRPRAAHKGFY